MTEYGRMSKALVELALKRVEHYDPTSQHQAVAAAKRVMLVGEQRGESYNQCRMALEAWFLTAGFHAPVYVPLPSE